MGRLISMDECSTVVMMKRAAMEFDYAAFNTKANAEFEKHERYVARTTGELVKQQAKRKELKAAYAELKEVYHKTATDRRLKESTREQRIGDIIEAMLNIEEQLCI